MSSSSTSPRADRESGRADGPPRPTARARQKADTRRRLLDAATEVFLETGPIAAPFEEIARRAGVSRHSLNFHFGNRVDLMEQVLLYHLAAYKVEAREYHPGEFRSFLEGYLLVQQRPMVRLMWQLGDLLHDRPRDPTKSRHYWDLVAEIETRLRDNGLDSKKARGRAVVLAPALMMLAQRVSEALAGDAEVADFVDTLCVLALGSTAPD